MKKFKFFAAVIAISMLFSATVSADFPDMPSDADTAQAINNAVLNGIISGYDDGTVRPDSNITRAEMASIITRAFGASKEADISDFSDVPADKWYHSAFSKAYAMGAFSGDDQKHMNPDNNITFQECFTILSQVFDLLPQYKVYRTAPSELPENTIFSDTRLYDVSVLLDYADGNSVADWAKVFVAGILENGGWNGENGNITPTAYITRGQFALVMNNIIKNYIDTPGTYTELPAGNTMIRCNGVTLDGVSTESDIFVSDNVEQGKLIINKITANRFVVRGCATETDENGKPVNDNFGIVISGTFDAIRIIRPYISANLSDAKYSKLYTAKNTSVNLGIIEQ